MPEAGVLRRAARVLPLVMYLLLHSFNISNSVNVNKYIQIYAPYSLFPRFRVVLTTSSILRKPSTLNELSSTCASSSCLSAASPPRLARRSNNGSP